MAAVPQSKPMMTIQESVKTCIRKYADFSGRATRAEYWWWVLATTIVSFMISGVDTFIRSVAGWEIYSPFQSLFGLAILLPGLAVTCRRLHDIGKTGWWQLVWYAIGFLGVIPLMVGVIIFVVSGFSDFGDWKIDAGSLGALIAGIVISLIIWLALAIWWIVWLARRGNTGPNRFGEDPTVLDEATPAGDGSE